MVKTPNKIEVTNAFKDFEKALINLCEILKNDRNGNKYADRAFDKAGEDPFPMDTMENQVKNVKGWIEFVENEIEKM